MIDRSPSHRHVLAAPSPSHTERMALIEAFTAAPSTLKPERPLGADPRQSLDHIVRARVRAYSRLLSQPVPIVWLASVSKSGNTWLRYQLCNALFGPVDRAGIPEASIPHWRDLLDEIDQASPTRLGRLIVKTHARPAPAPPELLRFLLPLTVGVIYICRNPKDVCLSQINHMRLVGKYPRTPDRDLAWRFLDGRLFPDEGLWSDHIRQWSGLSVAPVLILSYEDLKRDPASGLETMLEFLGETPVMPVAEALERSSFRRMQELEDVQGTALGYRAAGGFQSRRFVHRGLSDQPLDQFGDDFVRAFDQRFGPMMERLGYPRPRLDRSG